MRRFMTLSVAAAFGLAPALGFAAPEQTQQQPGVTAPANPVPDETIGKAGAALRDVAKVQEKYQDKFESATPQQKRGLSEQANAEAVQAIQSHGLSVQEYSNVVRTAQNNADVKQRLLNAAKSGQ